MPFRNPLQMEHIEGTKLYELIIPLYWIDKDGKEWKLNKGKRGDGHSIPWFLRGIAGSPFATKYPKSAWFHDDWVESGIIPRKEADIKYKEIMEEEDATKFQQNRNYAGVRIGAGWNWIKSKFKRRGK